MAKRKAAPARPRLSRTRSATEWLKQFRAADQEVAASLLDALLLLNEDDVASSIRSELRKLARVRTGARRRVALYTEREFAETSFFKSEQRPGRDGIVRTRAVGNAGPPAVRPLRGRTRVGSEGWTASIVSQAVEASPAIYLNNPGPDRIRRHRVGLIVIVTDFIGSGTRVRTMIDKFVKVPSVRAWLSNDWVRFAIVAAAGTAVGIRAVKFHRTAPSVLITYVVPTLGSFPDRSVVAKWRWLMGHYGPRRARGAGPEGYGDSGALVAFSHRVPNNTPLLLHQGARGWSPLFVGPPSDDLRASFGLAPLGTRVESAAAAAKVTLLSDDLTPEEGRMVIILRAIRGRWRQGQEVEFAERTGFTVTEILDAKAFALTAELLTLQGRLTEEGQKLAHAGVARTHRRPDIPTRSGMYYPQSLRAPR